MPERRRRDYAAEYRARIARGQARGLSRSQAAGHPRPGEEPVSRIQRVWRAIVGRPRREPPRFIPPPAPVLRQVTDEDYRLVPPEESSIGAPPEPSFEGFYDEMIANDELDPDDAYARNLLIAGWFTEDGESVTFTQGDGSIDIEIGRDNRSTIRDLFYRWTGLGYRDIDWRTWRNIMYPTGQQALLSD